jgi:hypothetical protein
VAGEVLAATTILAEVVEIQQLLTALLRGRLAEVLVGKGVVQALPEAVAELDYIPVAEVLLMFNIQGRAYITGLAVVEEQQI